MKRVLLLLLLNMPLAVVAQSALEREVAGVFENFLDALTEVDVERLAGLFTDDPLFWGTSTQTLATDPAGVRAYFDALGGLQPRQNVARAVSYDIVEVTGEMALLSGLWEVVPASGAAATTLRISIAVVLRDGEWKIAQFHNSVLPR